MKNLLYLGLPLLFQPSLFAQVGILDSTFGMDGRIITAVGIDNNPAQSLAIQPDGKIVVTASKYVGNNFEFDFAVLRYLMNGALDNSFGTNGIVTTSFGLNDNSRCSALQPDGKIIVAGSTELISGNDLDIALARYLPNGTLDNSFSTDGKVVTHFGPKNDILYGIAVQPDGKIVGVGNSVNIVDNENDIAVVRYNPDGSLDNSFGTSGKVITAIGTTFDAGVAIVLQPDGKILVAGTTTLGTQSVFAVVRYNQNGTLDNSFSGDGKQTTIIGTSGSFGSAIALQSDGKIVVVGSSDGIVTKSDICVVRYKTDGSLDNSFGTGGISTGDFDTNTYDYLGAVCIQPDGKIVVAGQSLTSFSLADYYFTLVRYNSNGTLDNGFGTGGKMAPDLGTGNVSFAEEAALQSDGKIVVAGGVLNPTKFAILVARCLAGPSVGVIDANATFCSPLIYPNPVSSGSLTLGYTLPATSSVHIELMDLQGKAICSLLKGKRPLGENQESLQLPEGLPSGYYLLDIQTEKGNSVVKINTLNR